MVTEPTLTPVTTPVVLMEAIVASLVLQLPPVMVLVSVIAEATHTAVEPNIAGGSGFTVMVDVI